MKELTAIDAFNFWEYLKLQNIDVYWGIIRHKIATGEVICSQPFSMTNEDYCEYKRILFNWLVENKFL